MKNISKNEAKDSRCTENAFTCVCILASGLRGTLYVGVTSSLPGRVWQDKNDQIEGFTRKHRIHTLVWYEVHGTMESAILREKAIKAWKRAWKLELIEKKIRNGVISTPKYSDAS